MVQAMASSRRSVSLFCLFLVLVTTAVYLRVGAFDFVPFDDREYVSDHLRVQAGLTWANILWASTTGYFSNWHPLTWLSYMLDCELFGPRPGPMHLVNVAWHVVNSVLLFLVLRRITSATAKSAFVAFLFALHPLHVESVAWISERKDVLSGFFFIVTIAAYAAYVRRPSWQRYLLTAVCLFLGLAAKPMLVTIPCVLLLLDYWPLNRFATAGNTVGIDWRRLRSLVVEKLPLFGVVAVSSVLTFLAQLHGRSVSDLEAVPLTARLANTGIAYFTYLQKAVWPTGLTPFYPHPAIGPTDDAAMQSFLLRGIVALIALLLLTAAICWLGRKHRYLTVGWLWFVGTLVPVIGLVQVGSQSLADRYTYIPLIGLFIMAAWGVPDLLRRVPLPNRRFALNSAACAIVVVCTALTWVQVGHWRNGVTLFSHAMEVNPNPRVEQILALALSRAGHHAEAIEHFENVVRVRPDQPSTLNLYAVALNSVGRNDDAEVYFKRSIELDPTAARVHYNYANLLAGRGDFDAAAAEYRRALQLERSPKTHNNLGAVLLQQKKFAEAAAHFSAALEISPVYHGARQNLERLLAEHPSIRPNGQMVSAQ